MLKKFHTLSFCAGVGDSFLEQQMAKLMARKGQGEGEGGGSSSSLLMKRSKSGDIPRPDSLSLVRSVSGELRSEQKECNSGTAASF